MNKTFVEEMMKQFNSGNKIDTTSFTKENGCLTNIRKDIASDGMSHMCNPKCNFKFTGNTTDTTKK
jgi:hypothetical protein